MYLGRTSVIIRLSVCAAAYVMRLSCSDIRRGDNEGPAVSLHTTMHALYGH